jgi:hypothetical protein
MQVVVPVGMLGQVHVPLLGRTASNVTLNATDLGKNLIQPPTTRKVWAAQSPPAEYQELNWLREPPRQQGGALILEVGAAELEFALSTTC